MEDRLYLVNLDKEFKGNAEATMTKGSDMVHYTGLSLPEYLKDRKISNYHLLDWDSFYELYYVGYNKSLQKPFKEITEDRYYDLLECLPPMRWGNIIGGVNMFFVMEAYTADLHTCVLKLTRNGESKYYSALRSKYIKGEEVVAQLKEQGLIQ